MINETLFSLDIPFSPNLYDIDIQKLDNSYSLKIINSKYKRQLREKEEKERLYNKQFCDNGCCTIWKKTNNETYKKYTSMIPQNRENLNGWKNEKINIYEGYINSYNHKVLCYYNEISIDIDYLCKLN